MILREKRAVCWFLLIAILTACTDNREDVTLDLNTNSVPLEISMSRAPETYTTMEVVEDKATMGIFRTAHNGYSQLNNICYTFDAKTGKWMSNDQADATKTVYLDHRIAKLCAVYPYQTENLTGAVLQMSGIKRYTEIDNLGLSPQVTANNDKIAAFTVYPIYSRLSLLLENKGNRPCIISDVTFSVLSGSFKTTASLDLNADKPTLNLSQSSGVTLYKFPLVDSGVTVDSIAVKGIAASRSDATIDMLWIPQSLEGMTVTITLRWDGDAQKSVTKEITKEQLAELTAGKHHQLRLSIKTQ